MAPRVVKKRKTLEPETSPSKRSTCPEPICILDPISKSLRRLLPNMPEAELLKWEKYFEGLEELRQKGHKLQNNSAGIGKQSSFGKPDGIIDTRHPEVIKLYDRTLRNHDAWKAVEARERKEKKERQEYEKTMGTADQIRKELNEIRAKKEARLQEEEMKRRTVQEEREQREIRRQIEAERLAEECRLREEEARRLRIPIIIDDDDEEENDVDEAKNVEMVEIC